MLTLVFSDERIPDFNTNSIFLEGPSPRDADVEDWRPEAVQILEELGFEGEVYIPRWRSAFFKTGTDKHFDYDNQIQWEKEARQRSDVLVCWLARNVEGRMPGFVTNFELGEDYKRGNLVYGRPDWADKAKYMDLCVRERNIPVYTTLKETLQTAINKLGAPVIRTGPAAVVPKMFWLHPVFQNWYNNQTDCGNTLLDFELISTIVAPTGDLFAFTFKPEIWIASEHRAKAIETVVIRPDISVIVPYFKDNEGDLNVVLTTEFRSAVNNPTGKVTEFPGGSSFKQKTPVEVALDELKEECGLDTTDIQRLKYIDSRQLAATMLVHRAHVYTYALSERDLHFVRAYTHGNATLGNAEEDEKVYVKYVKVKDLHKEALDLSMLGVIYLAFSELNV